MKSQSKVQVRTIVGLVEAPCFYQWKQDVGGMEFEFALHIAAGHTKGFVAPLAISELGTGFDVKAVLLHPNSRKPLSSSTIQGLKSDQVKKIARAALHNLLYKKIGAGRFLQAMLGAQMQLSKIDLGKYEVTGTGTETFRNTEALDKLRGMGTPGVASFTTTATPEQVAMLDSVFGDDQYIPSPEEHAAAMADADQMNHNMRTYGTIDAPVDRQAARLKTFAGAYQAGLDKQVPVVLPTQANCLACEDTRVLTTTDKDHEGQPIEVACTECIPAPVEEVTPCTK